MELPSPSRASRARKHVIRADGTTIDDDDLAEAVKQRAAIEMARLDADGDGMITREEYLAAGGNESDFDRYDWDDSGTVDRAELEAMTDVKFVLLKSKVRCISATLGAEIGLKHIRCWTHSNISMYCSGAI